MVAEFVEDKVYSWKEVSELHRGRHGIYQKRGELISLLTDFGEISRCYPDIGVEDGNTIFYTGSGRRGDQKLDVRNKALNDAIRTGVAVPLFCKRAVNRWEYLGLWGVVDLEYVFEDTNERMVWRFTLRKTGDRRLKTD